MLPPEADFTEEELRDLGIKIENEFNQGVANTFDQVFDAGGLFKRMIWPQVPSKAEIAEFTQGTQKGGGSLGKSLAMKFAGTGRLTLLHVRKTDHGTTLLYRFVEDMEGGWNYIEFLVGESPEKTPILVDMYPFSSGEYVSQTMRRLYASGGQGLVGKLASLIQNKDVTQTVNAIKEMRALVSEMEFQKALDYYSKLSKDVQGQKAVQICRMEAAMSIEDETHYLTVLEEYAQLFPNDPSLPLMLIDYHLLKEQYDSVLVLIDRLDAQIQDPWLNYQRAEMALLQKDYSKAIVFAEKLIQSDSTIIEPYYVLLTVAVHQQDYQEASRVLEYLETTGIGSIEFEGIEASDNYREFRASKEYQTLKRKYWDYSGVAAE